MKHLLVITTLFLSMLAVAHAEYRTIAIEVYKNEKKEVAVNIHSDVEAENKKGLTVKQASKILENAKGWGSAVGVAIKVDHVDLSEYHPLLSKVSDNVWLDLVGLSSDSGAGYTHIMKHYKIEHGDVEPK